MYRLSDIQGRIRVKKVLEGVQPSKEILKGDYVYVLDCFQEIFIWEGQNASMKIKKLGKKLAQV